jgi:hypothetical protein
MNISHTNNNKPANQPIYQPIDQTPNIMSVPGGNEKGKSRMTQTRKAKEIKLCKTIKTADERRT